MKFKKRKPLPKVGMPMGRKFNETVAMDLKEYSPNVWFLHLVDHGTRFSNSCIIKTKKKEEIVKRIFEIWIRIFGSPKKILVDNGGEFANQEFITFCENFNIRICTTAGESPWSNGIVERHNAILGITVKKIMADTKCDLDIAVAWAISAKNSLKNVHGYSSNQLVFGFNPNFPNVLNSNLPALEAKTSSEIVAMNLNAMHSAREKYIESESSDKLRNAIRSQVRTHNDEKYDTGDIVYYKRKNDKTWKGPASVIGQDGQQVFIKHGSYYNRVHPCCLQKKSTQLNLNDFTPPQDKTSQDDNEIIDNEQNQKDYEINLNKPGILSIEPSGGNDFIEDVMEEAPHDMNNAIHENIQVNDQTNARADKVYPKLKDFIECKLNDVDDKRHLQIISRAGKATGKYKHCYNVKDLENGDLMSVDFETITEWNYANREEVLITYNTSNNTDLDKAKIDELNKWKSNYVYDQVKNEGQEYINLRWVTSSKCVEGTEIVKARLVAKGFQENLDIFTDSPTCSKEGLRIVLHILASEKWTMNSIDIKSAFLQGKEIDRDVFVKPIREAGCNSDILWKLRKTVYGLNDASRSWYLSLCEFLSEQNVKCSKFDPSIFMWYQNDKLEGILCVHVDDFLFGGSPTFIKQVIGPLKEKYMISSELTKAFKYIGLNVCEHPGEIMLDQQEYINSTLKEIEISNKRKKEIFSSLTVDEFDEMQSIVGQLNYLASHSRPDLAFEASFLSSKLKKATVKDLILTNKAVAKVKANNVVLRFGNTSPKENWKIKSFNDASFGNLDSGGSQGGFLVFLDNGKGIMTPIMWQSKKVKRVVKSVMAAETLEQVECAEASIWIKALLQEIYNEYEWKLGIECNTDSKQLYEAAYSLRAIEDKRLRIEMAIIREMLRKREISSLMKIDTKENISDCLTKLGASSIRLLEALAHSK